MKRYLGLLLFSVLLLGMAVGLEVQDTYRKPPVQEAAFVADKPPETEYDLVYVSQEREGLFFEVGAQKKENEEYWIFLPWWCRQENGVLLYAAQELVVDGVRIEENQSFWTQADTLEIERDGRKETLHILFSSQIPTLWLYTENHEMAKVHTDKEYTAKVTTSFLDAAGEKKQSFYRKKGTLHCRGNVTFSWASKKSYVLESDDPMDFFQMGEAKKWILTSNYFDETRLRNYLTMQLAQQIGLEFTPQAEFVDLYVDGKYFGLYLLGEKVEVAPNRVALRNLEEENEAENSADYLKENPYASETMRGVRAKSPADITGGYLVEFDLPERWDEEASGFVTKRGQHAVIQAPKYATVPEVSYIMGIFQKLEDELAKEPADDGYEAYIDMESFAKKYLIEEISKNYDANKSSQFFYKHDDSISNRIFAGPVWDYDRAWGGLDEVAKGTNLGDPAGFYAGAEDEAQGPEIWPQLCKKDSFREKVCEIYAADVLPAMKEILEEGRMDGWKNKIAASVRMDTKRYEQEYTDAWERVPDFEAAYRKLYTFVEKRTAFLTEKTKAPVGD